MIMIFLGVLSTIVAVALIILAAVAIKKKGITIPAGAGAIAPRSLEILKISLAGAIFLFLLWILVPDFLSRHHKEIAVMVVAMIVGASLLGVIQKWEENSTRKILRVHYVALTIILVFVVLYNDPEIRKWTESFQPTQPRVAMAKPPVCEGEEKIYRFGNKNQIFVPLRFQCLSGWVAIPTDAAYYQIDSSEGWHQRWQWDGSSYYTASNEAKWRPIKLQPSIQTGTFRLNGENKAGLVKITIKRR